jgi:hypothetical protein
MSVIQYRNGAGEPGRGAFDLERKTGNLKPGGWQTFKV